MKCSHCGKSVVPIVVLDLDGTLADYHSEFTSYCEHYFGRSMAWGWTGVGNFEDFLGLDRAQYREAKLAYRQGGNKRWMETYVGVNELVESIRSGPPIELWIATTRPWQRLDNIDPDTVEWLRRNQIRIDGLLYGENKYTRLIDTVDQRRVVACLEDLAEQYDKARALGLPVFQIERLHNSGPGLSRVPRGNLQAAQEWISDRIERWYKEHA